MSIPLCQAFGRWAGRCRALARVCPWLLAAVSGIGLTVTVHAAVIEFFNPDLNNFFITADPVEQAFVDTGAVGRWQRTGNAFAAGGPSQVCRFGGNSAINPATGTFFGPNSHFYTADPAECAGLKAQFTTAAKSWKFESNDFLTTPAANGACPAGLAPVYRAYNNGFARGIDSNHRITSNFAAYQQTIAAGSIGEGIVMCAPSPVTTATGVASGAVSSATIGAAGGSVASADGRLILSIPAGALAADTLIGIQPVTNLAPGRIGAAYALTPAGQTFLQPVILGFTYTDQDLAGSAAAALGMAFQSADGTWQWASTPTVDAATKSVTLQSTHFSTWSLVKGLQMIPAAATVTVNGTVNLAVAVCYDPASPDPRGYDCDGGQRVIAYPVSNWSVNNVTGGNAVVGTVVGGGGGGGGTQAAYVAPATVPSPSVVQASARVDLGAPGSVQLVSNILIVSGNTVVKSTWTGTASTTTASGVIASAVVTWNLVNLDQNVATYHPSGTVSLVLPPCTRLDPASGAIDPAVGGELTIDYSTTPATYHGTGAATWNTVYTCPSGSFEGPVAAVYFSGSKGAKGTEAAGQVSADGNTIEGSDLNASVADPVSSTWHFVAQ